MWTLPSNRIETFPDSTVGGKQTWSEDDRYEIQEPLFSGGYGGVEDLQSHTIDMILASLPRCFSTIKAPISSVCPVHKKCKFKVQICLQSFDYEYDKFLVHS